jgi:YD repeat-containing protein
MTPRRSIVVALLAITAASCPVSDARADRVAPWEVRGPRAGPSPVGYGEPRDFHPTTVSMPQGGMRWVHRDVCLPAEAVPLVVERSRRDGADGGVFGPGWASNLDVSATFDGDGSVVVREADGRVTRYEGDLAAGVEPIQGAFPAHRLQRFPDGTLVRRYGSGARQTFDASGRLVGIEIAADRVSFAYEGSGRRPTRLVDGTGRTIALTYEGGFLARTRDPLGREIRYAYADGRLVEVVDALGRAVRYGVQSGRLVRVELPDATTTRFGYAEDGAVSRVRAPNGRPSRGVGNPSEPPSTAS